MQAAQDPEELFDVLSADGTPLGYAKSRAEVHVDGDWHRAVHLWVYGIDQDDPFVIFQRRGRSKDTMPLKFDATVGGHYRAGENLEETLREAEEEIGRTTRLEELRFVGVRIVSNEWEAGTIDREIQDVFLWRHDGPLTDFAPNPAELESLVQVPVAGVLDLFSGAIERVAGIELPADSSSVHPVDVALADFGHSLQRYPYKVAIAVSNVLRGDEHVTI